MESLKKFQSNAINDSSTIMGGQGDCTQWCEIREYCETHDGGCKLDDSCYICDITSTPTTAAGPVGTGGNNG